MNKLQAGLLYIISLASTAFTIFTVGKLQLFLSTPVSFSVVETWFLNLLDNNEALKEILSALLIDFVLLSSFILCHSLLRIDAIKNVWKSNPRFRALERSIYNLASCSCLLFMITNWRQLPGAALWEVDVRNSPSLWWLFSTIHGISWFAICSASVLVDLPELLGLKQTYNEVNETTAQKSVELRRLMGHIRHPSFLFIMIVLWVVNIMTLDRALLALVLSLYMYLAWNPDVKDVNYQKGQLSRKKYEICSFQKVN